MEQDTVELIKQAIEDKLHMANYLRKNGDDEESKQYHEGWCDLAYEILELIPVEQKKLKSK